MQVQDITVEVRDKTLKRVGVIRPEFLNVKVSPVLNGVGSWTLTLPADHALAKVLSTPGSGIIVTGPTDIIMSGPTTGITKGVSSSDPGGSVTFDGVDDNVILSDTLAFTEPTNPNAATQLLAHDVRTGNAESVMRAYVDANCGPSAPAPRKRTGLTLAANQNRGVTVTKSARFDVLGTLLQEIALVANLAFRVVQRGSGLVFEVSDRRDRSPFVRFDVYNGNLTSQEVTMSPPGATTVIVAGQGDLTDRQFIVRTTDQAQADSATWGRYIEVWVDQRNTNVVSELQQAGDEVLAGSGFTQIATKIVPSDDTTMRFGIDWGLGDVVTIVVENTEQRSFISGYNIVADSSGVKVGVILGDSAALDQSVAQQRQTDDIEQRVENLEKNTGTYQGTTWAVAPILSGWSQFGGTKQTLRYRRPGNGLVEIQGVVKGTGASSLVMTLPVGYRPDADIDVPVVCSGSAFGVATIATNGNVTITGTVTTSVSIQAIFGITTSS